MNQTPAIEGELSVVMYRSRIIMGIQRASTVLMTPPMTAIPTLKVNTPTGITVVNARAVKKHSRAASVSSILVADDHAHICRLVQQSLMRGTLEDDDAIERMVGALDDPRGACVSAKWDDDPFHSDAVTWDELKAKGLKFGSIYSNSMGMPAVSPGWSHRSMKHCPPLKTMPGPSSR